MTDQPLSAAFRGAPIVQVAYHVPDIEEAALDFSARFGWGPFFVVHHIGIEWCNYRGAPGVFDHSSAYGQAGPIMVELVQQNDDAPSAIRDMYRADQFGIHHQASFADDLDGELARYEALGFPIAMRALTTAGVEFAFVDTRPLLGHMLELYPAGKRLTGFYRMVREAAENWDGSEPIRRL